MESQILSKSAGTAGKDLEYFSAACIFTPWPGRWQPDGKALGVILKCSSDEDAGLSGCFTRESAL